MTTSHAAREWKHYVGCLVGLSALLLGVYALAGSFRAEFSGADEAAYVVSGVMVREYFGGAFWRGESPLLFAQQYYEHYPKVAIGHWPPVYFLVEGAWLTLTGISRPAILALSAITSATLATMTAFLCRREGLRWTMAVTAAVIVALMPVSLESLIEIGSDAFTGIAMLVATLCCQRWFENQSTRNGVVFGAAMGMAMLCKGTAFALLLLVPLVLFVSRKPWSSWWAPRTWMPNVLAVAVSYPWYHFANRLMRHRIVPGASQSLADEVAPGSEKGLLKLVSYAARDNTELLVNLGGIAVTVLALYAIRTAWYRRWPALAMLPVASWLFLSVFSPHVGARLLLHLLPVVVFSAAIAARTLAPRMQELTLVASLFVAHLGLPLLEKPNSGFVPAVAWLMQQPGPQAERILVSSNALGEGALISEFALSQPSPQRTILRASKVLQSSTWMGENLTLLAHSGVDVTTILDRNQVTLVVIHESDTLPPPYYQPHLEEALAGWKRVQKFGEVSLYQRRDRQTLGETVGRNQE